MESVLEATTSSATTTSTSKSLTAIIVSHAALIDNALEQIRKQSHQVDEIILIQCCGDITDEEIDIEVYNAHRDDFGHLARDIGLRLATKDYVWWVNCDDEYDPEFIRKLIDTDVQLAYCDWDERGRIQESYVGLGTITSGNFIIERKLAQKVGWNHRDYCADGRFLLDVWNELPTFAHIPEVLYTHR